MIHKNIKIAIYAQSGFESKARAIAQDLDITYLDFITGSEHQFFLSIGPDGLKLFQNNPSLKKPIYVDFIKGAVGYRVKSGEGKKQNLAKAVGIKGSFRPFILDTTAGLGKDSLILASLGCKVDMLERSKIIYYLLSDGLKRAQQDTKMAKIISQMNLKLSDALIYLKDSSIQYDIIYIDPMFPQRKKSALVKKEMRIIKEIVGDDIDAEQLLTIATKKAKQRVVVKRPRLAEHIGNIEPSFKLEGKANRFDIYMV